MVAYAAVGGAFAGFCWLPFGLAPLLPLAFLIALRGLRLVASSRDALLFGLVCGAFRHAVGGHYIVTLVTYSPLAILIYLLDISYVLPFAAMESWGAYAIERRTGIDRAIPFALLYTVLEWTRTVGDLSVPSDLLSHAFGTDPSWLAWSPVAGPHALTLVTIAVAILIDRAIERRSDRRKAAVLATLACALWLAPPATDLVARRTDRPALKPLRIGIVQPSVTIQQKLDRTRWPEMWDILKPLTREAARGADLVVWPESSRPGPLIWKDEKPFSDPEMEALAREVGVPILYGCELARFTSGQVTALYNAAALARPDGTAGDWYGKQQLLPFVEGIPFARLIGSRDGPPRAGRQALGPDPDRKLRPGRPADDLRGRTREAGGAHLLRGPLPAPREALPECRGQRPRRHDQRCLVGTHGVREVARAHDRDPGAGGGPPRGSRREQRGVVRDRPPRDDGSVDRTVRGPDAAGGPESLDDRADAVRAERRRRGRRRGDWALGTARVRTAPRETTPDLTQPGPEPRFPVGF